MLQEVWAFFGTLEIIAFAHLVTIPMAMAIAEIATNQKVEGGGEYNTIRDHSGLMWVQRLALPFTFHGQ